MWSVVTHGHLSETHLAVRLGCVRTSCVRVEFISLSWREDEKNLRERIRKNSRTGRRHRVPSTIERENQIGTVSLTRAKRPERTIVRLLFNHAPVRANRERVAALPRPRSRGLGGGHVPPPVGLTARRSASGATRALLVVVESKYTSGKILNYTRALSCKTLVYLVCTKTRTQQLGDEAGSLEPTISRKRGWVAVRRVRNEQATSIGAIPV